MDDLKLKASVHLPDSTFGGTVTVVRSDGRCTVQATVLAEKTWIE